MIPRLIVSGTDFTLSASTSGNEVRFKQRTTYSGDTFYRVESLQDDKGHITTYTYANDQTKSMIKVTDHYGRWFKFHYNNMGTAAQASTTLYKDLFNNTQANQWHDVTVSSTEQFRFLAFYQGNTWRQQTPMRVAEIEFYDENNNLITGGTPYGSIPLIDPANGSDKAFDGDTSTYYQYAYDKAAYCGIDLGAGNEKQVSRIRFYITSPVHASSDITFVGQNDPAVSNWVISHVESSDNRTVTYSYDTFADASGWFQWVRLLSATYPDSSQASYGYKQVHPYTYPLLETADDPRFNKALKHVRYAYDQNASIGYVTEEYNQATGQKILSVLRGENGHNPKLGWSNGRVKSIFYAKGRMIKLVDSYGFYSDYTYTDNNEKHLASESDALGRTTTYTRDAIGNITSMTSPGGRVTSYTRDSEGRPLTITRNGDTTTHTRDALGQITRTDHPDGTYQTWTYNTAGQKTTHRQRNGHSESWTYLATGELSLHTNAAGDKTRRYYYYGTSSYPVDVSKSNLVGRLAAIKDQYGNFINYEEYNDRGQILQMTRTPGFNAAFSGIPVQDTTGDFNVTTHNTYDDYGNLLARVITSSDPNTQGQLWRYTYDSLARKLTATDPLDRVTTWSYDYTGGGCGGCGTSSKPASITYPDGSVTKYIYDKEWRLLSTTRAFGTLLAATTSYTYDGVGQRITMTDPLGHVTQYTYDLEGRVSSESRAFGTPLATSSSRTYDLDGNTLTSTNAVGTVTSATYDNMNRAISTTVAHGTAIASTSTRTYSATTGELVKVTDPLGRDTLFEYDELNRVTKTTLADGKYTKTFYDRLGHIFKRRDLLGNMSFTVFAGHGAAKTTTDAAGITMTYTYDGLGHAVTVTYPSGKTVDTEYDAAGQRTKTILAKNTADETSTTVIYDNMGRGTQTTDGTGAVSSRVYDLLGRVTSSTDANSLTSHYTYDLHGQMLTSTAPDNVITSTRIYDALHRMTSNTDGANRTISYNYDAAGRMTSYTDAKNATFAFEYDALGRQTKRTEPDNTFQSYTYDLAGRLTTHTKADGKVKTYHYGNVNRNFLTRITYSNGEPQHTYSGHNAAGQPQTISNQHATITHGYDAAGRKTSETQSITGLAGSHVFSYSYNMDGQLNGHTRPDGSLVEYGYNARQLLSSLVSDGPPPVADYTYNGRNQLTGTSVENGLFTRSNSYDTGGRLTAMTQHIGTTTVLDQTLYTLDAAGQRTAISRNGQAETYGYDPARQVTGANYGATTQSWNYDLAGNRTSATTNGNTTNFTANLVNEYTLIGTGQPQYDTNGNLTANGTGSAYTWDINNRLVAVSKLNGDSGSYGYDPLGRRVKRTATIGSTTTVTFYLHNGWNVELEHDGTQYTKRRSWGLDLSGSLQGAGGVGGLVMTEILDSSGNATVNYYPAYDGNGNITALIDNSATVVATWKYDAYGNTLSTTGTPSLENYGFSTKPYDELTGLYYYGYRYYDPVTGRWPSRDPLGDKAFFDLYSLRKTQVEKNRLKNEIFKNLYSLVCNQTINKVDKLGLKKVKTGTKACWEGTIHWYLVSRSAEGDWDPGFEDRSWGFYAEDIDWDMWVGTVGDVRSPESQRKEGDYCREVVLDDCCYDIVLFRAAVAREANRWKNDPPAYYLVGRSCANFVDTVIKKAMVFSKKENAPWWCAFRGVSWE